jgi:transglutaminase-like putative cysteine protease
MLLAVRHLTTYRYAQPIASVIQTLRLTPRAFDGLTVIRWRVRGDRARGMPSYVDGFGNLVHLHAINRPHQNSTVLVEGQVETQDTGGAVRGAPEPLPPAFFLRTTPLTEPDAAIAELAAEGARGGTMHDRLLALMHAVHQRVAYQRGSTDAATSAASALANGSGVSQDHAHLLIAACRALDVPARYVAGYLWTGAHGEDRWASHAWVEAYLENDGWFGFDSANATPPSEAHIRISVGLDYWSAAPVRGFRRGEAEETLSVTVEVAAAQGAQ